MKKKEASKSYERATFWILIKQQVGFNKESFVSYKMVCGV